MAEHTAKVEEMGVMPEFFSQYLRAALFLIAIAIALTIFVFRRRLFERGPRKGTAADPDKVREQNPPDPPR